MDEGFVDFKGYAQVQAESAVAELIALNAVALSQTMHGYQVDSKTYRLLRRKYYECLQNASEIINVTQEDYRLPEDHKSMALKIMEFINKMKEEGFYSVGKKIAPLYTHTTNSSN